MKKFISAFLVLCFILSCLAISFAEDTTITINLANASDEEIENAILLLKNEQRARLKTKIELDQTEIKLPAGSSVKINAEIKDLAEDVQAGKLIWKASDESVISCSNNGTIKARNEGNATATCSTILSDGTEIYSECQITVYIPVKSINAKSKNVKVYVNETKNPEISVQPANATNPALNYTSSDEAIAVVNPDGTITGKGYGSAEITVQATDGSGKSLVISVEGIQREGESDKVITFMDIPWGSKASEVTELLKEADFCKIDKNGIIVMDGGDKWFSLDKYGEQAYDLFWNYQWDWGNVRESSGVTGYQYVKGEDINTKVGGYSPSNVEFTYYRPITEGVIDKKESSLSIVKLLYTTISTQAKIDTVYNDLKDELTKTYGKPKEYKKKSFCVWYGKDNTCIMCGVRKTFLETDVTLVYAYTDIEAEEAVIEEYLKMQEDSTKNTGV